MPDRTDEKHPIAAGLIALVGVGLVVGLILGLVVLVGTRVVGLGGDDQAAAGGDERSMYLPKPAKTTGPEGPLFTLGPGEDDSDGANNGADEGDADKDKDKADKKKAKKQISFSASTTSASPMQQIDMTGTYPGGEGAILQVQRFQSGHWEDFPVTVSVSNQTFSTYVQTSQAGVNRFRVVDTDTGLQSNPVRVTIH
jgi:hypothetical protein